MKMNISMSMGFLKPIGNFFKKYTALLPSIIITVAALLMLPLMLMVGGSVKEQMGGSIRTAGTVSSLLQDVPSRRKPELVKNYMDRLEEETDQIETMAVESSRRELISYDVFPLPRGTSSQLFVAFGRRFREAVEAMVDSMHALDAPSENEIRNQTGAAVGPAAPAIGRPRARTDTVNPMVDALCLKRAQKVSVYAHPAAFPWYDFWERYEFAGQRQALEDCWDTQTAFWIYQDIADTISAMNASSNKVATSPVKRLMGVSFTGQIDAVSYTGNAYRPDVGGFREKPNYVILPSASTSSAAAGAATAATPVMPSNFIAASLTNRSGNEDVDVIHFTFSVLVDNRYVMAFMKELCSEKSHAYRVDFQENGQEKNAVHNQITILDTEIRAVDKTAPEHEFYRYGNGAVMQLDLVCEYQFCRKGYDVIKPDVVKELLGQKSEQPEQAPVTAPARSRGGYL
jgi:hypothetical protein